MKAKKFLIPVGAAVAALVPVKTQAAINSPNSEQGIQSTTPASPSANSTANDPIIRELTYPTQAEIHALALRQSSTGSLYAQHGSHMSHHSHHSHASHRSGY